MRQTAKTIGRRELLRHGATVAALALGAAAVVPFAATAGQPEEDAPLRTLWRKYAEAVVELNRVATTEDEASAAILTQIKDYPASYGTPEFNKERKRLERKTRHAAKERALEAAYEAQASILEEISRTPIEGQAGVAIMLAAHFGNESQDPFADADVFGGKADAEELCLRMAYRNAVAASGFDPVAEYYATIGFKPRRSKRAA